MDLQQITTTYTSDDQTWLGSATGTGDAFSATVAYASLVEADHFPDGFLPSGTILGKITASGKYGPYDPGAADGTEVAAGVLLEKAAIRGYDVAVAVMWHGRIIEANLPLSGVTGEIDAAGKVDLAGRFVFV